MFSITTHDDCPADESAIIDQGMDDSNHASAPLHEVVPISCIAKSDEGEVIGGILGRRWGQCCEVQQLWVAPAHRHQGLGTALLNAFEAHAEQSGCISIHLETFSFQLPALYKKQGYQVKFEQKTFPHGIVKFHMAKHLAASD